MLERTVRRVGASAGDEGHSRNKRHPPKTVTGIPPGVATRGHIVQRCLMNMNYDPFFSEHRADPYTVYAELRRSAPVYWAEPSKMWVISRYDDVMSV